MCSFFYNRVKGQTQPFLKIILFGVMWSFAQRPAVLTMTPKINNAITVINNAISDSLIVAKWVSETKKMKCTLHTSKSTPFGASAQCSQWTLLKWNWIQGPLSSSHCPSSYQKNAYFSFLILYSKILQSKVILTISENYFRECMKLWKYDKWIIYYVIKFLAPHITLDFHACVLLIYGLAPFLTL